MRRKVIIFLFFLLFVIRQALPTDINTKELSPYRILQKSTSAFFDIDSVEILAETWFQAPHLHIRFKFKNIVRNFDDYKVEGRVSFSSLLPHTHYSSSSWVQSYNIRGIPFTWISKDRVWKKETLKIEDPEARETMQYALLRSLFYINEETIDPSTLKLLGVERKGDRECFVVQYRYDPEIFKKWSLVGDGYAKFWIDKEKFLPVAGRIEGKLGDMNLLQIVTYKNYNSSPEFKLPPFVGQEVKKEKERLREKLPDLIKAVAKIRGWQEFKIDDVKIEFVKRKKMKEIITKILEEEYPEKEIQWEEKIFKWLNLIPEEADYRELLINSQISSVAGLYDPKQKTIFVGDWLEPSIAEIVSAHEIAHAYQDKVVDLEKFFNQGKKNYDLSSALKSLIEGEAFAVSFEYLLNKDGESFKNWEDVTSLIEENILTDSYLRNKIFYNLYGYGAKFIQACLSKYDWRSLDTLYNNPPFSMREVMHPAIYIVRRELTKEREREAEKREERGAGNLKISPPQGWRDIYSTSVGEYFLYLSLDSILEKNISEKASSGWNRDRLTIYENDKKEEVFSLLTSWDTEKDALEFFQAYKQWLTKKGFTSESGEDKMLTFTRGGEKTIVSYIFPYVAILWTKGLKEKTLELFGKQLFSQLEKEA